jgi:hypothetical protein
MNDPNEMLADPDQSEDGIAALNKDRARFVAAGGQALLVLRD